MDPPFFGVGVQYLAFARQEPELYKLLFLQQNKEGKSEALAAMERSRVLVRPSLMKIYRMEEAAADLYFRNMWLVVHSLATLLVTGGCTYGPEEMEKSLPVSVSVNAWPVRRFRALFPAHMTGMHCLQT